jgi:hypothetical protein
MHLQRMPVRHPAECPGRRRDDELQRTSPPQKLTAQPCHKGSYKIQCTIHLFKAVLFLYATAAAVVAATALQPTPGTTGESGESGDSEQVFCFLLVHFCNQRVYELAPNNFFKTMPPVNLLFRFEPTLLEKNSSAEKTETTGAVCDSRSPNGGPNQFPLVGAGAESSRALHSSSSTRDRFSVVIIRHLPPPPAPQGKGPRSE